MPITGTKTKTKEVIEFLEENTLFCYEVNNSFGDKGYYHCREALIRDVRKLLLLNPTRCNEVFFNLPLRIAHNELKVEQRDDFIKLLDIMLAITALATAPKAISVGSLHFITNTFSTEESIFSWEDACDLYEGSPNPECIIIYNGVPKDLLWYSPVHISLFLGIAKLALTITIKYPSLKDSLLKLHSEALTVISNKKKAKALLFLQKIKKIITSYGKTKDSDLMPMVSPKSFVSINKLAKESSIKLEGPTHNWEKGNELFIRKDKDKPFGFGDYEKFSSTF